MDRKVPKRAVAADDSDQLTFVKAFQRLVGEVFRLNGQMLANADRLSRDLEVSTARWQIIATIRYEPFTVAEISRRLGLKRQSTQETVNRLHGQGLVEFQDNPRHSRASLVNLTPAGLDVMATLRERQVNLTEEFTRDLNVSVQDLDDLTVRLRNLRKQGQLSYSVEPDYNIRNSIPNSE